MPSSTRPLVVSYAQQPLMRQIAATFPALDVRFVDDIAAPTRISIFNQARAMIVAGNPVNAHTLEPWTTLEFVQTLGSGYNNVDLSALQDRHIAAAHNPGQNAYAVAEHALMSAIYLMRHMGAAHTMVLNGQFSQRQQLAGTIRDMRGLTLALYGMGQIGQQLVRLATPFGMNLIYYQRHRHPQVEHEYAVRYVAPDELWKLADIVVLTVPLTDATFHLVGKDQLACMKPGSVLINVGRGPVVDEQALAQALIEERLYGAALDVFETEPLSESSPLRSLPPPVQERTLFSPHISGVTQQALTAMATHALENVQCFFAQQSVHHVLVPRPGVNLWQWQNDGRQKSFATHPNEG
ncbi:hypothetical protein BXT84_12590 [Sulfobacillus thermotolerans]|uniref:D-isomer specific 2-hydroxyacid dehydrogenase NAD-binding domain-containing protein n=1 Tax=Sulfobacillus thermotolerans TaxID=338644 RepID=A0ABM6RT88_9FIRM|nr:hypothetical protein BXT84_12590 [Sulfobacillus thermotolerans]